MSIATSITGGSSSNQLLDLLAVVANPDVYKAKLDALDAATAENKKYVEAIGPASEVVALRDEAKEKVAKAKDTLAQAEVRAEQMRQAANDSANATLTEARAKADAIIEEATTAKSLAEELLAQTQAEAVATKKAKAEAAKAQASAQAREQELIQTLEDAKTAKAEAEAIKADILAKHQEFIQGL
jgi:cell division septum initiation protein DivIVA